MTDFLSHAPGRLIVGAIVAAVLAGFLAVTLGWHALRRLFGLPRIPKPPAMYVVLTALWAGLAATVGAAIVMALLLRDYQAVNGRTRLAEVRCQELGPGRSQMELTVPSAKAPAAPERYEVHGDACVVSVVQLNLRPGLAILGPTVLSRVDRIGSEGAAASGFERRRVNSPWLTLGPAKRPGPLGLLIRQTRDDSLVVPAGGDRFTLLTSAAGPELEKAGDAS